MLVTDRPLGSETPSNMLHVFPHYIIDDGIVRPDGIDMLQVQFTPELYPELRAYQPADCPQLPEKLAGIRDGNESDVLSFVHQFGMLGHDSLARMQGYRTGFRNGDPLDWFFAHTQTVRLCLQLTEMIQNEDGAGIEACLDEQGPGSQLTYAILSEWVLDGYPSGVPACPDPIELARATRRTLINGNTRYLFRYLYGVTAKEKSSSRVWKQEISLFGFTSLIEVIYQHLADVVLNGNAVRRCKNKRCGRYFVQATKRQEYCPPRPGQKKSSCGKNALEQDRRTRLRHKKP